MVMNETLLFKHSFIYIIIELRLNTNNFQQDLLDNHYYTLLLHTIHILFKYYSSLDSDDDDVPEDDDEVEEFESESESESVSVEILERPGCGSGSTSIASAGAWLSSSSSSRIAWLSSL